MFLKRMMSKYLTRFPYYFMQAQKFISIPEERKLLSTDYISEVFYFLKIITKVKLHLIMLNINVGFPLFRAL